MYDFEKYYANIDAKAEVNIDLSGVDIEKPQGNPNEHVTNNVVYYVTGIQLANDVDFSVPVEVSTNDRVKVDVRVGSETETSYISILHPLADVLDAGIGSEWHPGVNRESLLVLDSTDDPNEAISYTILNDSNGSVGESYAYARVSVAPRYEFITGNGNDDILGRINGNMLSPMQVNQNVISDASVDNLPNTMQAIYALLGLYGKRKVALRTIRKISNRTARRRAVIEYDTFRKRMGLISDWCAENNYGVDVKYYDRSMAEPLPEGIEDATADDYRRNRKQAKAKHRIYQAAMLAADITRTTMKRNASFLDAYGTDLPAFLSNPKTSALVDNLTPAGDGVTALIPPVKDAAKGIFYPREEIENDFYSEFTEVYDGLKDALRIMRRYLSSKTKRKIRRLGAKFSHHSATDGTLSVDLDSLINLFDTNYGMLGVGQAMMCTGNNGLPEQVTVYPRVFQVNGVFEQSTGKVSSWGASPDTTIPGNRGINVIGMHFVYGSNDYSTDDYSWDKAVCEMTSDEVRSALVDAYNWVLKRDGLKPIDVDALGLDDTSFTGGYNSLVDSDIRYRQCKRYIQFVGAWMNLIRSCGTKEGFWAFSNSHMIAPGESMMDWLLRLAIGGLVDWNLSGTYRVLDWETASSPGDGPIDYSSFHPGYELEWGVEPDSPDDIDNAVSAASIMVSAYKEMKGQLLTRAPFMSTYRIVRACMALESVSESIEDLEETVDRIIWYQAFVNESAFTNRSMYLDRDAWLNRGGNDDDDYVALPFTPWALPARFMVPVAMYRKVRKKYRRWGMTRHKTVKVYDGVRWAEVRFYDLNVYSEYPQVEETPGQVFTLEKPASVNGTVVTFDEPLPGEIYNAGTGELTFGDPSATTMQVVFDSDIVAHLADGADAPALAGEHEVVTVKVPPEKSRNDGDALTPVTVHVESPSLPYDEEIRKKEFVDYGPMSQDKYFDVYRFGSGGFPGIPDRDRVSGWKAFRPTSRKIEDMREGIGVYDKLAFLVSVLEHEFGKNRVDLINTWRSGEDQKGICTGGPESEMLSWHNYGLAAKILIYQDDCTTPIVDKSDDMKRLVKVARALTDIFWGGRVGAPCNLVWCGRLKVNPSLFDWEFLPVGVEHKDAIVFREALLAQKDPVIECSYVDVDANGLVVPVRPEDSRPYVLESSSGYRNAVMVGGHKFMAPDRIANYETPSDIVLYDVVEFIDLINLKMAANGNTLGDRGNMYEWKTLNDSACTQLIRYFALTNNLKSAKALLAGDFVEKYQAVEDAYYSTSVVDYVKNMLGDRYETAYVTIDNSQDAGFITLHDGKLHVQVTDIVPDNVPTMMDMHGQQRVDENHIKRGVWRDGVFYETGEIEIPFTVTEEPVIEGYVDGVPEYGGALALHQAVASELHAAFIEIRDMFEKYTGPVMYDRFRDGPNADKFEQLENEFGAIAAQDLVSFDELDAMLSMDEIGRKGDNGSDGDRHGGPNDIYEKVIDNAQIAGMRKAIRTTERMHITNRGNGLTPGQIYRAAMGGRAPDANDIMSN